MDLPLQNGERSDRPADWSARVSLANLKCCARNGD